jgi:hypothetical protein
MNQIPSVPMTNPYMVQQQTTFMPVPQPKYNAVNIEINNPSVGTPGSVQQPAPQVAQATPVYNYPTAPVYNYPTAQAPVYYPPVQPQAQPAPEISVAPVQTTTAPVQPTVVPVEQQNVNQPVPAPVVTAPTAENAPAAATKPEVIPSETVAPQVDMNSFIAKLSNPDFDVQAAGMEDIANLVNESPEKATELVDSKIFDALTNIVNFDSSALEGPTKEQIAAREKVMSGKDVTDADKELANKITPKEQAERNKSYALFTSALMQKLYGDEVSRLANTTVPLTELPGAITVVDNLKDNPNPMVRASAIEALSYIQNPAYKKDLTTVFSVAQNDSDPGVAETAKVALEKLNQIQ